MLFQFSYIYWDLLCVWVCSQFLERSMSCWKKEHIPLCLGVMFCEYLLTSIWLMISFNSSISLLGFCLNDLSVGDNRVPKSPTISVWRSVGNFSYTSVSFWTWVHLCKNWNIFQVDFSFEEYVVSVLISSNQFWSELYFVRCWNSYTSLLLRSICLEWLSILFLRWCLSLILRYVSWIKPQDWFSCFQIHSGSLPPFYWGTETNDAERY